MLAYKLEKDIVLYKNQFDNFLSEMYDNAILDRASIELDGLLFRIKYMVKNHKDLSTLPELKKQFIEKASVVRSIFASFAYDFLLELDLPEYCKIKVNSFYNHFMEDVLVQDVRIDNVYVKFKLILISQLKEYIEYVDNAIKDGEVFDLYPGELFRFYTDSYNDGIAKAFPELFETRHKEGVGTGKDGDVFVHNFTFQTSERCNLNCFPAKTQILMADYSLKNIEEIKVGDMVLGIPENIKDFKYPHGDGDHPYHCLKNYIPSEVTKTFVNEAETIRVIYHYGGEHEEIFRVTREHPFLTVSGEFMTIEEIMENETSFIWINGNLHSTQMSYYELQIEPYGVETVYNMETTTHTYVANCAVVHNCTYCLAGDTVIPMADGVDRYKFIKDIKVGDVVSTVEESFNYDEYFNGVDSGEYDCSPVIDIPSEVTKVFHHKESCYRLLFGSGKPLLITGNHPMLTRDGRWVQVKDLKNTDSIIYVKKYFHGGEKSPFMSSMIPISLEHCNIEKMDEEIDVYNFETETHTYIANGLIVHNCYQFNKSNMRMEFDTAKKFIDNLLDDKYGYINRYNSPAIIIEFIGGEPFLEINLTRKIYEYFLDRCYELNHPWFTLHRVSICSNGLLYFDEDVQSFFKDYASNISFNISIDGNKELHDSCRIQPNGEGSYDIDMMALDHYNKHYTPERNSKMTLAPSNISYLYDSVVDFIKHDMMSINMNCVFEEGWNQETAKIEYYQLKKLADYLIDNNLEHLYIAIFNERQEDMQDKYSDGNFCFKAGTSVLSINGDKAIEDVRVGDILYTASGSKHKVVKTTSYTSDDNKILRVTGSFPIHCTSGHKVFAKKFMYMGWKGVIHYSEPGFYPVSELKKGDRVALPILDLSNNKPNWIDKDTAYAIGIFLADGHINHRNNNVVITPGYDTDQFYYDALKRANLGFTTFKGKTTIRYIISRNGTPANERFYKVCESCGHLTHNKHFPRIIFESPADIIREVIKGYCDTDGYIVTNSTMGRNGLIKINSVSPWLMNDLMILLRSIGEYPTCYHYKRAGKMITENRIVNVKDRYEVYYNPSNRNSHNMFKIDDCYNVMWAGIQFIDNDPEKYDVYCPTVMPMTQDHVEEHSIIINGLAASQCGGTGSMLSLRPNGQFYPCIRYMPTSVGDDVKDLCIGNIDDGIIGREQGSEVLQMMDDITRRSQMNDICYECPIGNDCAACSALGHAVFGTPNKRTTFTCIQMIAEALANVYYWNRLLLQHPEYDLPVRKNNVPDEWSLLVIDKDELDELKLLELAAMTEKIGRSQ